MPVEKGRLLLVGGVPKLRMLSTAAAVVAPPPPPATSGTLTVSTTSATAGAPFLVNGTFALIGLPVPTAMDYTINGGGSWLPAPAITTSGTVIGTFSFTMPSLTQGTYLFSVRDHANPTALQSSVVSLVIAPGSTGTGTGTGTSTISVLAVDKNRVFNRTVYTGNPSELSTTFGKGWAPANFTINCASALSSVVLKMRLRDQASPGTYAAPGTIIQSWTTVPGVSAFVAGNNPITVNLPASLFGYIVDFALGTDLVNGTSLPNPVWAGFVDYGAGRSHALGMFNMWAYGSTNIPSIASVIAASSTGGAIPTNGFVFAPSTFGSIPVQGGGTWENVTDYGTGHYNTAYAAEYLRCRIAQTGVAGAFVGYADAGSNLDQWSPGSLSYNAPLVSAVFGHLDGHWDVFHIGNMTDAGLVGYPTQSAQQHQMQEFLTWISSKSVQPFAISVTVAPGWSGQDGMLGFGVTKRAFRALEANFPSMKVMPFVSGSGNGWGTGGHTSMLARVEQARNDIRVTNYLLGPTRGGDSKALGPKFTGVATRDAGSAVIKLKFTQGDGTALVGHKRIETTTGLAEVAGSTYATATGPDLGWLFNVYPAGVCTDSGSPRPGTSLTQATTNTVQLNMGTASDEVWLTLAAAPADNAPLDVVYAVDMWYGTLSPPTAGGVPSIRDNTNDNALGIPYGREMQHSLDPIYVPPPVADAPGIGVNTPPFIGPPGCLTVLDGTGPGPRIVSITTSTDAGADVPLVFQKVLNGNQWSGGYKAPSAGTHNVTIKREGGQNTGITLIVPTAINSHPAAYRSSVIGQYDALNFDTLSQDIGGTIRTDDMLPVRGWADAMGNTSNFLGQVSTDPLLAPYLVSRAVNTTSPNYFHPATERPQVIFEPRSAPNNTGRSLKSQVKPLIAGLTGDCTILIAMRTPFLQGGAYWSLGCFAGTANAMSVALNASLKSVFTRSGGAGGSQSLPGSAIGTYRLSRLVLRYQATTGVMQSNENDVTVAPVSLTDLVTPTTWDTLMLGGSLNGRSAVAYGGMRLHELVFVNRLLTDAEVGDKSTAGTAQNYLSTKWIIS